MRRKIALGLLSAALVLTGCSNGGTQTGGSASGSTPGGVPSYDVSKVEKDDALAALVPADVRSKGKLVIGASPDYAPAEFRASDLQTAIGYDVDMGKALGKVLGLDTEVSAAEFASLLPGMGSKYDLGISSFTITDERTTSYNMISYITVGSSFAVRKGNPDKFSADDLCGKAIGVQTGTFQETDLADKSKACTDGGKQAINVLSYGNQSDVTTNLAGGKIVAFYADSTVADYSVKLTNGQLEVTGGVIDAAPQGIVVAKDDPELTAAVQKAMQKLMDDGTWNEILKTWGISNEAALKTAELNPKAS